MIEIALAEHFDFIPNTVVEHYLKEKYGVCYMYRFDWNLEFDDLEEPDGLFTLVPDTHKIPSYESLMFSIKPKLPCSDDFIEFREDSIERDDPELIKAVKAVGGMRIIEIPDDVDWQISQSEPFGEWIAEKHRTWH